jgi:hypothetical protein
MSSDAGRGGSLMFPLARFYERISKLKKKVNILILI